ncbi:hypothetical protein Tco_1044092 [Tanacetum coccineum]|uniref:Uncharacterized protein n=1 Tax=Tanacetum coccineum TaxID=301880 RepID=A0ABQ5GQX4_9ASTR
MQLSPSTPSQPQALEIGETSWKSAIKRHEEQIQGIQGYLEEIPPEHQNSSKPYSDRLNSGESKLGTNHKIPLSSLQKRRIAEVINDIETRHHEDI